MSLPKLLNVWELRFISKHFARAALLQELTAAPGTEGLRPLCASTEPEETGGEPEDAPPTGASRPFFCGLVCLSS